MMLLPTIPIAYFIIKYLYFMQSMSINDENEWVSVGHSRPSDLSPAAENVTTTNESVKEIATNEERKGKW